jgi:hypothetical protein
MFVLGHVGVGSHLLPRRFRSPALWRWTALGCLLPDLVDKSLWLAAQVAMVRDPLPLGLGGGTRLFGHTLLVVGSLLAAGWLAPRPALRAVGLGAATHLALDLAADVVSRNPRWSVWLLWPSSGWGFPPGDEHLLALHHPSLPVQAFYLLGEVLGASLLLLAWWQRRRAAAGPPGTVRRGATAQGPAALQGVVTTESKSLPL